MSEAPQACNARNIDIVVSSPFVSAERRMKPWKENGAAISSEEVNFLVFRYLQESGKGLFWGRFTAESRTFCTTRVREDALSSYGVSGVS